ncbi:conserved Plasmodium protein, unknown function [Plasmodium malariae]|uniref:HIT-type domain-containing protein n=1 Tax=Plasmodium malariae TaxID=5858 RepID=A0A1D3JKL9_PLAMA|nr:conserved Plasmodium protein, unknown function [Plasmodium malariae]SBT86983.1 conserved Plasmodium protein, unknown function [Plasmodium malariae]
MVVRLERVDNPQMRNLSFSKSNNDGSNPSPSYPITHHEKSNIDNYYTYNDNGKGQKQFYSLTNYNNEHDIRNNSLTAIGTTPSYSNTNDSRKRKFCNYQNVCYNQNIGNSRDNYQLKDCIFKDLKKPGNCYLDPFRSNCQSLGGYPVHRNETLVLANVQREIATTNNSTNCRGGTAQYGKNVVAYNYSRNGGGGGQYPYASFRKKRKLPTQGESQVYHKINESSVVCTFPNELCCTNGTNNNTAVVNEYSSNAEKKYNQCSNGASIHAKWKRSSDNTGVRMHTKVKEYSTELQADNGFTKEDEITKGESEGGKLAHLSSYSAHSTHNTSSTHNRHSTHNTSSTNNRYSTHNTSSTNNRHSTHNTSSTHNNNDNNVNVSSEKRKKKKGNNDVQRKYNILREAYEYFASRNVQNEREVNSSDEEEDTTPEDNVAKDKDITTKDEDITTKDEGITTKDEGITTKDEGITTKDEGITTKDEGITTKDEGITTKDEGITTKDEGITTKDEGITTKDEGITTKDEDLTTNNEDSHYSKNICNVCKEKTYKYRCPFCEIKYCSLICSKTHKSIFKCKNKLKKNFKLKNVGRLNFDENLLHRDFLYLQNVERIIEGNYKFIKIKEYETTKLWLVVYKKLKNILKKKKIYLLKAPIYTKLHKDNKTYISNNEIFWMIKITFINANVFIFLDDISEHTTFMQVLNMACKKMDTLEAKIGITYIKNMDAIRVSLHNNVRTMGKGGAKQEGRAEEGGMEERGEEEGGMEERGEEEGGMEERGEEEGENEKKSTFFSIHHTINNALFGQSFYEYPHFLFEVVHEDNVPVLNLSYDIIPQKEVIIRRTD